LKLQAPSCETIAVTSNWAFSSSALSEDAVESDSGIFFHLERARYDEAQGFYAD
jgi:hypothetical protein